MTKCEHCSHKHPNAIKSANGKTKQDCSDDDVKTLFCPNQEDILHHAQIRQSKSVNSALSPLSALSAHQNSEKEKVGNDRKIIYETGDSNLLRIKVYLPQISNMNITPDLVA